MRWMKNTAAIISPICTAMVRSKMTVSAKVTTSTSVSRLGNCAALRMSQSPILMATAIRMAASTANGM
ncbi:hypothetical protein D3C72_1684350 [compost metagenome]